MILLDLEERHFMKKSRKFHRRLIDRNRRLTSMELPKKVFH
jgi:hypothetical protein